MNKSNKNIFWSISIYKNSKKGRIPIETQIISPKYFNLCYNLYCSLLSQIYLKDLKKHYYKNPSENKINIFNKRVLLI